MTQRSPLYELQRARGAEMIEQSGWLLPRHFGDPVKEYWAVRSHVGLLDLCDRAYLRIEGPDRVPFVQGMVSNDVKALAPGRGLYSGVLDVNGKILADIRVFCDESCFYVDLWEPLKEKILGHLHRYLVADEVEIIDVTKDFGTVSLQGPKAPELLRRLWAQVKLPPERYSHGSVTVDQWTAGVIRDTHTAEEGFDLVIASEGLGGVIAQIEEAGRSFSLQWVGRAAQETLRIEAGLPLYGVDMDEGTLLLETGLDHAVNFQKGCYLGQEVVERIRSRGHVNRRLVGLLLEGLDTAPREAKIHLGEKEVGKITSSVFSPALKRAIALGYVAREQSQPGTPLTVRSGTVARAAEVFGLPFYRPVDSLESTTRLR